MSLSQNLRTIMKRKSISINALERTAGVKPGSVQNILYGRSKNPGIETLIAIANALSASLEELRGVASPISESDVEWDKNLYTEAAHVVCQTMNHESFATTKRDFLECVDKVYEYSKKSKKDHIDQTFAKWLLQEKFQK